MVRPANALLFALMCIVPCLAFFYNHAVSSDFTNRLFEGALSVAAAGAILMMLGRNKIDFARIQPALLIVLAFCTLLILKIILQLALYGDPAAFYYYPALMEVKPLIFLIISCLIVAGFGTPTIDIFIKSAVVLSILTVGDVIVGIGLGKGLIRPAILNESNYDGFLILLGLLAVLTSKPKNSNAYIGIYFCGTLATQSKTGLAIFLLIIGFNTLRNPSFLRVSALGLAGLLASAVVAQRLMKIDDPSSIDRFVFWISFVRQLASMSGLEIIFGHLPGIPLAQSDPLMTWFINYQGDRIGVKGLHAFSYHSMIIRMFLTWGLFSIILFAMIIRPLFASKNRLYFGLLVLLQGFSMGVFYLSTVSVPAMLYLFALTDYERRRSKALLPYEASDRLPPTGQALPSTA